MVKLFLCAAAAGLALGCGASHLSRPGDAGTPPPPAPDGGPADLGDDAGTTTFPAATVSGTRLRARTWVAADGTRRIDTVDGSARGQLWYDSKLKTPCTFQGPADDSLACVPLTPFGDPANAARATGLGFLDAACQGERVAQGPDGTMGPAAATFREASCGAIRYATLVREGTADPGGFADMGLDVFELGASVGAAPVFRRPYGQSDGCEPIPAGEPNHFFRLGRKVARSELVAGHVETVHTGHRMAFSSIVAADGARQRVGWYDTALGAACTIQQATDGQLRCLPHMSSLLFLFLYGDAGCRRPITLGAGATFATPGDDQMAFKKGAYYRLEEQPQQLFVQNGTECTFLDGDTSQFRFVSDELPATTFDAFPETTQARARLETVVHADREGAIDPFPLTARPFPTTIADAATHQPCDFTPTADGKLRCLPQWGFVRYTSPACGAAPASRVVTVTFPDRQASHAGAWSGDVCTGGIALSQVGRRIGPQTGTIDVWDTTAFGEFCVQAPFARDDTSLDFYGLGEAEPLSAFEEATLVTE